VTENQLIFLDSLTRSVVDAREDGLSAKEIDEVVKNRGCPAFLLNIEKRSLPRLMLSGDGLASKDTV
jgi:hypothetical protein